MIDKHIIINYIRSQYMVRPSGLERNSATSERRVITRYAIEPMAENHTNGQRVVAL
jgi:hypothetical protein